MSKLVKLLKNADAYTPFYIGKVDILIAGEKILRVEKNMNVSLNDLEVYNCEGLVAIPGFIDPHVHITGGGGEGGFSTRTFELKISDCVKNGVTTVVGCLGTDGVTRSLENLYAKAKALEEEGITAYIYTGSYHIPPVTFTGSIQKDLVLIDKVVGVGEIAISDHRSSQPTFEEVLRVVADVRVGGMISGKPGIVNFHVGNGIMGIDWLFEIVRKTEIPIKHLYPTHMSRNKRLFEQGLEFAKIGGTIDLTALQPYENEKGNFSTIDAVFEAYENGLIDQITLSSDGQGSLPKFDKAGIFEGLAVGSVGALFFTIHKLVEKGLKLDQALKLSTTNPSKVFGFKTKGRIMPGCDADIVLLRDWDIVSVVSRGEFLMKDGILKPFNFD
ncbi:MAG: beta-aspartyl-peptidase [Fervidobacterium sp.]